MPKQSIYFTVPDMDRSHGPKELKKEIDRLTGVISVSVAADTGRVAVDYDSTGTSGDEIRQKIEKLGYAPQCTGHEDHTM